MFECKVISRIKNLKINCKFRVDSFENNTISHWVGTLKNNCKFRVDSFENKSLSLGCHCRWVVIGLEP